ncbi:MAG: hypothetical protein IJQ07_05165 [Clostridia bacterium]|nr:hypothetical protein [Clostridia bacterium]
MKRRIDYRHFICVGITLGFFAFALLFLPSFGRIIESVRDFGLSAAYYFCEMFEVPHGIAPTVMEKSAYPVQVFLPFSLEEFAEKWQLYWQTFATKQNILEYLKFLGYMLADISKFLIMVFPFVIALYIVFIRSFKKENNDYNKDSKPLKAFKWLSAHIYRPVKAWLKAFFGFVKNHKWYYITWLLTWLLYFNFYTVVIEFVAYYLYFIIAFDFKSLYIQFYKLLCDLAAPATFIPLFVWAIIGYIVFDRIRKKIGYAKLNHNEMKNRGFINARPIVFMVCGTMGKKKTTTITDMALSQEVMFRDKAFEKILENDLKFPFFPWINFENEIKRAMKKHEVYNLATCRKFVKKCAEKWRKKKTRKNIFDYDFNRYGLTYDDKLKVVDIWKVLETYAQLYFIFVLQSSLIISNYSVRTDNVLSDIGNFPMWDSDFFKRDSRFRESFSRHSHILDFDSLRLGRKVLEDNPNKDVFEFGVILITEIGKERGNVIELADKIKKADTANQKNDLFNSWLKMIRHSGTVDNFPFVRVITDEQRPASWGLDARELCEIVSIKESGETRLTMPFFSLAELLYGFVFGKFTDLYYRYRYSRGDNTLFMYLLKKITSKVQRYYTGIYNRFGYCGLTVQVESGTQDGEIYEHIFYISFMKIYSDRFATDCFSGFYDVKALRSMLGLDDIPEYETEKASINELKAQNSYFVNDLIRGFIEEDKK